MIEIFEFMFILSTAFVFIILPYVSLIRKEFILDITNKDEGLTVAQLISLFMMVDLFTLKALPLLTKVSVMTFILLEFEFKVVGTSFNTNIVSRSQSHNHV
jgi:hypothetical protein